MIIDYGPPPTSGVKQLQYMSGADDADYITSGLHQLTKPVVAVAAGAFLFGWLMGKVSLRRTALAVGAGALAVKYFTR